MTVTTYKIVDRTSGKIIGCEASQYPNPAYDAFLKGYDLIKNEIIIKQHHIQILL